MKLNDITIPFYLTNYPEDETFTVYRVSDGYVFQVKEVKETTILLNHKVNIEIPHSDPGFKVHPSSLGLDWHDPKLKRYALGSIESKNGLTVDLKKELSTRLHEEHEFVFGRILRTRYYPFLPDNETPDTTDLVAEKIYDYTKFATNREVLNRVEIYRIFNELGEVYSEKFLPKKYMGHQGMKEARTRRDNIIEDLKHTVDNMSSGSGSPELKASIDSFIGNNLVYMDLYVKFGSYAFVQSVLNDTTHAFLNGPASATMTIRQFIVYKVDFLSYEKNGDGSFKDNVYLGSLL